jgi:hypothetical protein
MAKYIEDFRQGETKTLEISYQNETVVTDITGYQFKLILLTDFGVTPTLEVTTTAGDDPADVPTEGLCYLTMTSTDSANIPPGKYYYMVQRIISGTPDDIFTIMPPIKDYKDKVLVVDGAG